CPTANFLILWTTRGASSSL
ncbi:MAG: hypothetical protein AVDCRST_MAG86-1623, partial [uncultured Truepera sp.]